MLPGFGAHLMLLSNSKERALDGSNGRDMAIACMHDVWGEVKDRRRG